MKIELSNDHENDGFCEWLNSIGHDATIGDTTGSYVDGEWTSHDDNANMILNDLWAEFAMIDLTPAMTPVQELQNLLFDSDGNHPDDNQFKMAMAEFRDSDSITGYWFVDVSKGTEDDLYLDPWSGKMLQSSDCGPRLDEIDFTPAMTPEEKESGK